MRAQINIKICRDPATGHDYRAVYLGRQFIASHWQMHLALGCALRLAAITGAEIHRAEIIPFPKAVA